MSLPMLHCAGRYTVGSCDIILIPRSGESGLGIRPNGVYGTYVQYCIIDVN